MEKAAFKLDGYQFVKASINFDIPNESTLHIQFFPQGKLSLSKGKYSLTFEVIVSCGEGGAEVVNVTCKAQFSFGNPISSEEEVPRFFYPNSLAIVFPYVRAFVSTMTLQANIPPVVLPTVNLTGLSDTLQRNTEVSE